MARKIVNGELVDMTPDEEAAFEAGRTLTLVRARREMRERIATRRVLAEQGGFTHLTIVYSSRGADLARLSMLAERARTAKAAADGTWRARMVAADDSESNMNADEVIALEKSAGDHFVACAANARSLRQAVNAAADTASVLAVDINDRWPA